MSTLICSFDGLHDNRVLRYYYALCLKDGTIVTGEEPEFEDTTEVAPSFRGFLQMLCDWSMVWQQ